MKTVNDFNFAAKKQDKPTVYTVGDSTVKNGSGKGDGGLWGWGDFIGQFLDLTKVTVSNHALGGTSSRTFQDKGLWEPVFKALKKGDYVMVKIVSCTAGTLIGTPWTPSAAAEKLGYQPDLQARSLRIAMTPSPCDPRRDLVQVATLPPGPAQGQHPPARH